MGSKKQEAGLAGRASTRAVCMHACRCTSIGLTRCHHSPQPVSWQQRPPQRAPHLHGMASSSWQPRGQDSLAGQQQPLTSPRNLRLATHQHSHASLEQHAQQAGHRQGGALTASLASSLLLLVLPSKAAARKLAAPSGPPPPLPLPPPASSVPDPAPAPLPVPPPLLPLPPAPLAFAAQGVFPPAAVPSWLAAAAATRWYHSAVSAWRPVVTTKVSSFLKRRIWSALRVRGAQLERW